MTYQIFVYLTYQLLLWDKLLGDSDSEQLMRLLFFFVFFLVGVYLQSRWSTALATPPVHFALVLFFLSFFLFCGTGVWTQSLHLELLYQHHPFFFVIFFFWDSVLFAWVILLISAFQIARITGHHMSSCSGYFWDGVSWTICQVWTWTAILLISTSQAARITMWATGVCLQGWS
jgi:hypothetical protein